MTKEFRPIEKAPLYEMDKDGNIQKIEKKTPAIPYPTGSRNVYLTLSEKERKSFNIDNLIQETFGEKKESVKEEEEIEEVVEEKEEKSGNEIRVTDSEIHTDGITNEILEERAIEKSERAIDTANMPSSGHPFGKKEKKEKPVKEKKEKKEKVVKEKKAKKVKEPRRVSSDNPIIEKIMKLECMESIKMWKLHQNGISNADITILVDDPHDFVVVKTLEKYTKNETLRNRADKVEVK